MPRSPSTYALPTGTLATTGKAISSTAYNAFVNDVKDTFNTPTPIAYGGTGATTASDARDNLGLTIGTSGDVIGKLNTSNTFTLSQTIGAGTGTAILYLDGATGNQKSLIFQTEGDARWRVFSNTTSESGSNAGSNLVIQRYDDTGAAIDSPVIIRRDTGRIEFGGTDAGVTSYDAKADDWVLNSDGNTGFTIASGNANTGSIYFADDGNAKAGAIEWNHTPNVFNFRVNDVAYMKVEEKGFGYPISQGIGGTVTQGGSKSTDVTLNKVAGTITTTSSTLAAATTVNFNMLNTNIEANDILVICHQSGGTIGSYTINAKCSAGQATIHIRNNTAGDLSEALTLRFALIKSTTN